MAAAAAAAGGAVSIARAAAAAATAGTVEGVCARAPSAAMMLLCHVAIVRVIHFEILVRHVA